MKDRKWMKAERIKTKTEAVRVYGLDGYATDTVNSPPVHREPVRVRARRHKYRHFRLLLVV